jgi:hypothetical protein
MALTMDQLLINITHRPEGLERKITRIKRTFGKVID